MTSLDEILIILGMNSSEENPITIQKICDMLSEVSKENNCTERVRSFLNKFPYLFKRIKSTEATISKKKPYKYWLSEKGIKYFSQRTGNKLIKYVKELQ